jgi:cell division protein YceG involved in septum cleavage
MEHLFIIRQLQVRLAVVKVLMLVVLVLGTALTALAMFHVLAEMELPQTVQVVRGEQATAVLVLLEKQDMLL